MARPDGYTLLNAGLSNVQVTPNFAQVPYGFDSFTPVVKLSSVPLGLLVKADSPYADFEDFAAAAKGAALTQGSWGAASSGNHVQAAQASRTRAASRGTGSGQLGGRELAAGAVDLATAGVAHGAGHTPLAHPPDEFAFVCGKCWNQFI